MRRRSLLLLLAPLFIGCPVDGFTGPSGTCGGAQVIVIGATASNTLGENECSGPGDVDGHLYTVVLTEQTNLLLTMTPSGFEGAMGVWDVNNKVVFEVNGSGAKSAKVFLPAGQYTLVAGRKFRAGGSYTLMAARTVNNSCVPGVFVWTVPGATITGQVNNGDCDGVPGVKWDGYEMWLDAGQRITATASVNQPANLWIYQLANGLSGVFVPKDSSRTLTFTAPARNTYSVRVFRDPNIAPIDFTLAIR